MDSVLRLEDVARSYRRLFSRRKVEAVRGISLEVRPGEIFGLLGPNRSGKTTTIQMILGLLRPSGGRIELFRKPPGDREVRRRIGYLPEEFEAHGFLTGEELLRYYGGFYGLPREEVRRRAEALLVALDLEDDRHRRVREYSKGMRRRIGLAQALLHEPDLVILDEPTNGLDPVGIGKVKGLLAELRARGRTIVVSSHILPEMEDLCDRVAIIDRGRILVTGTLEELLGRPDRHVIAVRGPAPDLESTRVLLASRGLELTGIRRERSSLEEVFLKVVKESQGVGA